ncbi:DNA topoisomerase IB [Paractinoplanes lichenicola]|uniref:DNA topoisomerase n=1 Tax=Paractinoplanes lichenicola TaxID=2802976 RepID=A0ABS1VVE9_9ACTN|nr:DNA topoisomerase IB [Actinoplanes lichenicola]MBL7258452.1 DNA topoisomerase IB [Actinoplanes lichenicola]
MRLRRSDLTKPGYARQRTGKGFSYRDTDGSRLTDSAAIERIKALVLPPAWTDVWISPDPRGHIQATGVDVAGRKQYRYHDDWRVARDEKKFDHALEVAARLPKLRDRLHADLTEARGLTRERVLAAIVRLLDMGMFRIGSDQYAVREDDPSFGLSTLQPSHVRTRGGCVLLEFKGKSGVDHSGTVGDGEVCQVLRDLKIRRRGENRLFAFYDRSARRWRDIHADDINDYLREVSGEQMSAKDFRTWHGTVEAARALADQGPQPTESKRKKAVSHAMKEVADLLGNTPAVARASYVDPRVLTAYEEGEVVRSGSEKAVRELIKENAD